MRSMLFKNQEQLIANGQTKELKKKRNDAIEILTAALESVNPYDAIKRVFKDNLIALDDKTFNLTNFDNICNLILLWSYIITEKELSYL